MRGLCVLFLDLVTIGWVAVAVNGRAAGSISGAAKGATGALSGATRMAIVVLSSVAKVTWLLLGATIGSQLPAVMILILE